MRAALLPNKAVHGRLLLRGDRAPASHCLRWGFGVVKWWGRGLYYTKSSKRIDFSYAFRIHRDACAQAVQPAHSSETQGTRDSGGRILALSLGPFVGSDELILDLPGERGGSWGSFASSFSFTPL